MHKYIWHNKSILGNLDNLLENDVTVIIGAGLAGLGAAKAVIESGGRAVILEKDNIPGGRVKSSYFAGQYVSLGAAWIEEYGPITDILLKLEDDGKLELITPAEQIEIYTTSEKIYSEQDILSASNYYNDLIRFFLDNKSKYFYKTVEELLSDYIAIISENFKDSIDVDIIERLKILTIRINQHTNGVSISSLKCYCLLHLDSAPVLATEEEINKGYEFLRFINGDLNYLIEELISELLKSSRFTLSLNSMVSAINIKTGDIIFANANKNKSIKAKKIINTLPVSQLQAVDLKSFIIGLSDEQIHAINKLQIGHAKKIFIAFDNINVIKCLKIPCVYKNNIYFNNRLVETVQINNVIKFLITGDDVLDIEGFYDVKLKEYCAELLAYNNGVDKKSVLSKIKDVMINNQVAPSWPITPNLEIKKTQDIISKPCERHVFAQDFVASTNSMNGAYLNGYNSLTS